MKGKNYENLHIGNFLISIGYYIREIEGKLPASVNLTQQSGKADYTIGDLFGMLKGQCFIIEFKKDQKSILDEMKKPQRQKLVKFISKREDVDIEKKIKELRNISIKSHLLSYPVRASESMDYNFTPYIASFDKLEGSPLHISGVSTFVDSLISKKIIGASIKEIKSYIDLLKIIANNSPYDVSGVIFSYSKQNGFAYLEYENLNMLEQKLNLKQEINLNLNKGGPPL